MADKERRSSPRIHDEELTLRLNAGDFDSMTHTVNISSTGLYCKVDKPMPPMSRVRLVLMMPERLEVDGVVVREHPVIIGGAIKHYDAAIFFDNLSQKDRDAITGYIARKKKNFF